MGGVISYMGDDYIAPSVEIQSDAHATDLDNSKVQTGQTIKSYIKANENIPISEADYAALTPEEIAEGKTYFRYEAPSLMRDIQDDGTATSLTSGALPTGQTITSYLNSNFVKFKTVNNADTTGTGYIVETIPAKYVLNVYCGSGVYYPVLRCSSTGALVILFLATVSGTDISIAKNATVSYTIAYF